MSHQHYCFLPKESSDAVIEEPLSDLRVDCAERAIEDKDICVAIAGPSQ